MAMPNMLSSYKDETYSKDLHSSYSHSLSQQKNNSKEQPSNGSYRYFEEYSFNKRHTASKNNNFQSDRSPIEQGKQFESRCNSQLIRRYSQIYSKLHSLQNIDIIHLFLQELHQNEQYRQKILQAQLQNKRMELQISELKELLQSKRTAIRKLCQTQTNNLNLLQFLQQRKHEFNWDSYFKIKYQQLETCMNEYISSTNEAQEEITRSYKILKIQKQTILQANQQIQAEYVQAKRLLRLTQLRLAKSLESSNGLQQKQREFMIQLQQLKGQNDSLHKQVQQLKQKIKENQQQFEIEVRKENKQISSDLDFIREKLNPNFLSNNDGYDKLEVQRLIEERQQLMMMLNKAVTNNECLMQQKQQLQAQCVQLTQQLQSKNQLMQHLNNQGSSLNHASQSHSISNNSRFEPSRGEFSRIEPNSSSIDTSSFAQKLLVATSNANYKYENLF